MTHRLLPVRRAALAGLAALALAACGSGTDASSSPAEDPPPPTAGGEASASYPVTLQNCGGPVTFQRPPQRVVLLKSASVPYLHELGVMGSVISRAGAYDRSYYDDAGWAELEKIPLLTDKLDASGHLQISKETVLALEPDLVLGSTDTLNRETLAAAGVPLLEEPALCPEPPPDPSFDAISEQLTAYGKVFGKPDIAAQRVTELRARVQQTTSSVPVAGARTAAVLYPTVGGGTTYAYGSRSMAQPQLQAAGFRNVFGDVDERVFEVTLEELIKRDPAVLVLLYSEGDPADVQKAVTSLPGADSLRAVRDGNILVQLFNFTEPPTPLALTGLQRIVDRFRGVT